MSKINLRNLLIIGIIFSITLGIILEQANKPKISNGEKEISILIDAGPRDQVFWEAMKKSFEENNPDIKIKFIKTTQEEKVMTMIAGGVAPDILLVPGEKFLAYLVAGAMLDITDLIKRDSAEMDLQDVYPITIQPFTFDKHIYGLSYSICPFVMFYNRDLFQKYNIPFPDEKWTWQDLRKAAIKLTHDIDKDGVIDEFGLSMNLWADPLYSFIFQNGGKVLSDDGKRVEMDNPKTIEAVKFVYDLIHKDRVVQTTFNKSKTRATFKDGKTAMLCPGGIFWLPEFRFYENLDFDIAPLPSGPNGRAATIVPIGYAIYSKTRHPEESYRFLKFLNGKKAQEILARSGLFLSCRKSINHSEAFLNPRDPNTGKEYKYPKHIYNAIKDIEDGYGVLPQYTSVRWWLVLNLLNEKFDDLFYNPSRPDKTPESVCKEITIRGNELINIANKEIEGSEIPWDLVLTILAIIIFGSSGFLLIKSHNKTKKSRLTSYENKWGYALISPWIVGFVIFLLGPILVSIFLSFCRWSALNPPQYARFIGLQNYKDMFTDDPKFIKSLLVTSYYSFLSVPLGLIAGIILALLMNVKLKGMNYFRVLYFLPAILPSVAVTVLWSSIFRKDGILNYIFLNIYNYTFGLIFGQSNYQGMPDWLGNSDFTIPALVIMSLWAVGGGMMIYLAGLQGISPELYEAAEIDGAGAWKKFWKITLPQLSPVIFFNLIMGIIGSFQVFNQAYILFSMSGDVGRGYGGPEDSALFYVLQIYHKAFKEFQIGYASSLAWILFIIILIFTLLVFKSSPMWVYYEGKKERKGI